ncbi:hypothetical protein F5146DRAFT_1147904 [Armillaria mellea]|nr:hypothetical protein F5146DRAFT_1147904 [Armillaria mellea]
MVTDTMAALESEHEGGCVDNKVDAAVNSHNHYDRAYEPRFMSTTHCALWDNVHIFEDINAKKVVAMHWYPDPEAQGQKRAPDPSKMRDWQCKMTGVKNGYIHVTNICETKYF